MRKRRFGDRYDGYKIKNDSSTAIAPHILKDRCDSQTFFDTEFDLAKVNLLIRQKRAQGIEISLLDFILAAIVRTISQYPKINRFVAGRRLYARNTICLALVIKKALNFAAHRTFVKLNFKPESTLNDINSILHDMVNKNKGFETENEMDWFIKKLNHLPRILYSALVNLLSWLDFHGMMPKFIEKICPFHSSVIITNMGSVGADPIYHNICNWGTNSIFIAIGAKRKQHSINDNDDFREKRTIRLRITADGRIADKTYLSESIKYLANVFLNPELLEVPPKQVIEDY